MIGVYRGFLLFEIWDCVFLIVIDNPNICRLTHIIHLQYEFIIDLKLDRSVCQVLFSKQTNKKNRQKYFQKNSQKNEYILHYKASFLDFEVNVL